MVEEITSEIMRVEFSGTLVPDFMCNMGYGSDGELKGRGGSVVGSVPRVRKVAGSNPTLAATFRPWVSPSLVVACIT